MINTIVDGICKALNLEFGDNYKIYTENVEQGLDEPCFLVQRLNTTYDLFLGNRYHITSLFAVQYFPSEEDKMSECADVAERLFDCLELISYGSNDSVRGSGMEVVTSDDVLTFTVSYNFYADKESEKVYMEQIDINGGVK